MGIFKKITKKFKKIVKGVGKAIKKVTKPVTKVVKKVWKGIKKVGGKIMKAVNKAGIIGQIGLMLVMPYAMAGIGNFIGAASGGISATWSGFGNWANSMMQGSSAFSQAVGSIAKGIHSAGALVGKGIQTVSGFIDSGFKAFSNATGIPNPIEGFSEGIKRGYTKGFEFVNNNVLTGKFKLTDTQLEGAGVKLGVPEGFDYQSAQLKDGKYVDSAGNETSVERYYNETQARALEVSQAEGYVKPEINMPETDLDQYRTNIDSYKFNELTGTYEIESVPGYEFDFSKSRFDAQGKLKPEFYDFNADADFYKFNVETGKLEFAPASNPFEANNFKFNPESAEMQKIYKDLGIQSTELVAELDVQPDNQNFLQKGYEKVKTSFANDPFGTISSVYNVVKEGKNIYDSFQQGEGGQGGFAGAGIGELYPEGRGIDDMNFFRGSGQVALNLNAYAYDMQRYNYG
tara:strand:- start:378 stop:1754 length:1377 start_codon:yes stop_codon:yes gene_type:complete